MVATLVMWWYIGMGIDWWPTGFCCVWDGRHLFFFMKKVTLTMVGTGCPDKKSWVWFELWSPDPRLPRYR